MAEKLEGFERATAEHILSRYMMTDVSELQRFIDDPENSDMTLAVGWTLEEQQAIARDAIKLKKGKK